MISINNLSKNYGKKVLFERLNLAINRGEKIGLIGPNGAGKSTLFSIILHQTEASGGAVRINKNIRIGYLPQEAKFPSHNTVLSEICEGDSMIKNLLQEKDKLEQENAAHSNRYGDILHELDILGYFELEHKAEKILMGLGFKESDFTRMITHLSGGWQMRVLLAKLLTVRYDLLLLDEPTNYLDLNAALWLKNYLSTFNGAFIMISHDKAFLNGVTNYTLILENMSIFKVKGNYEHYEVIKREKHIHLLKQFNEQEKKRKQLERFIVRFRGQPNKAAQARAKRAALERMKEIVVPQDVVASIKGFHFPETKRSGERIISLNGISKSYGDICVYKDFDFEIGKGEKAVLAGENGAGKSTLLKILAGVLDIDNGERCLGYNVDIGYFSQTRMDVLNPQNSVLDEAYSAARGYTKQEAIRTILGAFLFSGDDVDKKVKILSGGEKSRLIMAKLLINPPNFLLLDEPTTHLDVDAVEALIKALNEYEGTIVFISHDIYFVRMLANCVFDVKNGIVRKFTGNFDYYLEKKDKNEGYIETNEVQPKCSLLRAAKRVKTKKSDLIEKNKEEVLSRKEKERNRKKHNNGIRVCIDKLKREKDELNLEYSAKSRAVTNPRSYRDDVSLEEYIIRLDEIKERVVEINNEIKKLNKQFISKESCE
ncbi:MAG TPA: ATP-binding cassette domain-containing protein [Candidatus Omnitrophica bacterium]|nr:ATP-binding cassette domain-containing protein [Candidatus Omnitrophota bacterium]